MKSGFPKVLKDSLTARTNKLKGTVALLGGRAKDRRDGAEGVIAMRRLDNIYINA